MSRESLMCATQSVMDERAEQVADEIARVAKMKKVDCGKHGLLTVEAIEVAKQFDQIATREAKRSVQTMMTRSLKQSGSLKG